MSKGIDYGMGRTNIDREAGIRYGVINQHEVLQAWCDSSEGDYGEPHCPECGNDAVDGESDTPLDVIEELTPKAEYLFPLGKTWTIKEDIDPDSSHDDLGYKTERGACGNYACDSCKLLFDGENAFGEDPLCFNLDDGEYKATQGFNDGGDIFILSSPYYTRAQFCSPCSPGACYLTKPMDDGDKAYCFGHDWFEGGAAPYPIYSVKTNELIPSITEQVS